MPAITKSGVAVQTGTASIVFGTAFPNTDYAVNLALELTTLTNIGTWAGIVGITNKLATGFDVEYYDATLTATVPTDISISVHWTATSYLDA